MFLLYVTETMTILCCSINESMYLFYETKMPTGVNTGRFLFYGTKGKAILCCSMVLIHVYVSVAWDKKNHSMLQYNLLHVSVI